MNNLLRRVLAVTFVGVLLYGLFAVYTGVQQIGSSLSRFHAVALLALPAWPWVGRSWIVGVVLFSGSLYWLALGGPKILGPITPLGGVALLFGWALLAWHAFKSPRE